MGGGDAYKHLGGGGGIATVAIDLGGALDFRITRSVAVGFHGGFVIAPAFGELNFGHLGL